MITLEEVQAVLNDMPEPVLTFYINTDNALEANQGSTAGWRIWLKNEFKRISADAGDTHDPVWAQIAQEAESYIAGYEPESKGLAVFIGAEETRAFPLEVPMENRISYGTPLVAPLLWIIDEYEPYLIVMVDQEKTNILNAYLGQMGTEDQLNLDIDDYDWGERSDYQVGGTGQGDSRELFDKMIDEHRMRYFREVVTRLEKISTDKQISRIIFGGAEEHAKAVINLLPKRLADMVIGWLPIPFHADRKAIIERAFPAAVEYERQQEITLVNEIIDFAKSHGRGALGFDDVMLALEEQRVELLVLPYPIQDEWMATELPLKVRASGGAIELVHGEAAENLKREGGIGARLYYAITQAVEQ